MLTPPIARSQDGIFTRAQARAAEFSWWRITTLVESGTWQVVLGEAFALDGLPVTPRMRARAAALTTGSVVSHWSAADLHGLGLDGLGFAVPDRPHVITTPRTHVKVDGVAEHRLRLAPHESMQIDGIAVTTRRRTVVDLLASTTRSAAMTLLFRAVQQSWLTEDQLRVDIAARRNWAGTPQLRDLADLLGTGAHSTAERALHDILRAMPNLRWKANANVTLSGGGTAVVDVLLPDANIVIEVDGRRFHGADQFQRDRTRQNALAALGLVVIRFTWQDVVDRPGYVRRTIEEQLRRAA